MEDEEWLKKATERARKHVDELLDDDNLQNALKDHEAKNKQIEKDRKLLESYGVLELFQKIIDSDLFSSDSKSPLANYRPQIDDLSNLVCLRFHKPLDDKTRDTMPGYKILISSENDKVRIESAAHDNIPITKGDLEPRIAEAIDAITDRIKQSSVH